MARDGHSPGHRAIPAESNHPHAVNPSLPLSLGPNNALRPTQVDDLIQVTLKEFLKDNTISQQIMTILHPHKPLYGAAALARAAM